MLKTSDYFIFASVFISLALSIFLWFSGSKQAGLFVGLWVPSLLGFASYLKTISRGQTNG